MGQHTLKGTWIGLGKLKDDPQIKFVISGTLKREDNDAFRSELFTLAHKYGLHIDPPLDPETGYPKPKLAKKKLKRRPRKK